MFTMGGGGCIHSLLDSKQDACVTKNAIFITCLGNVCLRVSTNGNKVKMLMYRIHYKSSRLVNFLTPTPGGGGGLIPPPPPPIFLLFITFFEKWDLLYT